MSSVLLSVFMIMLVIMMMALMLVLLVFVRLVLVACMVVPFVLMFFFIVFMTLVVMVIMTVALVLMGMSLVMMVPVTNMLMRASLWSGLFKVACICMHMLNATLLTRIEFFLQAFDGILGLLQRVVPMNIPIISFMAMRFINGLVTGLISALTRTSFTRLA